MPLHVLVTGSTRGIGRACADLLEARGCRVARHGSTARDDAIAADLAEPGAGDRLWDAALRALDGRIDGLVNNAGVFEGVTVDAEPEAWAATWERSWRINLQSAADLSRRAVLHWKERGDAGRIVNVASRAAFRGDSPAHWHYAAAKAGMIGLTKSIARAYAGEGILAFAVAPGFVDTDMAGDYIASRGGPGLLADIPLGRVATPDEVAAAVAFLALDAPASMTGATLDLNGASYVR